MTKPGGVVVWVVGDATVDGSETGTSFRQALHFMDLGFSMETMIYDKNGFRFPHPERYHQVFEYMFVFSKGKSRAFNPLEDRICQWADTHPSGHYKRERDGSITVRAGRTAVAGRTGKRYNIWRYAGARAQSSDPGLARQHPAIFPEALARDHIRSWSNPGDVVLDPMCGSGTVAKMCVETGRQYIGIDMSEKYCALARRRVAGAQPPLFLEDSGGER